MMNKFTFLFLLFSSVGISQPLYFSFPFQVSDATTGNTHPRVTLVNNDPFIVWGAPSLNDNLFFSKWNGTSFNAPQQLTYNDEMVMLGYAEGPVVKSKGDSVYIIYVSMGMTEHRVYMRKSIDGGINFSDTLIVNDRANGVSLEYANMELDEMGNPSVVFIRNEIGDYPKNVFYRSMDAGNTFLPEVVAIDSANGVPCECCPASLQIENNYVYTIFRNNISNIRDFYVSISDNGGISFDSTRRIDNSNWFSGSCPASGPSAVISGDSLLSVFMVKINNQSLIKAAALHKTNLTAGSEIFVDPGFPVGSYNMNYPEIAGSGDTIGIVWQDNRTGQNKIYMSTSLTGLAGLSSPQLVSDFTGAVHVNPHLVFKNGIFHITWRDFTNSAMWYRKASFDAGILSIADNNTNDISIYPNPANDFVQLSAPDFSTIEIYDLTGKIVISQKVDGSKKINTGTLCPGVYQIKIIADNFISTRQLIIQR